MSKLAGERKASRARRAVGGSRKTLLDPISLELIDSALRAAAVEMGATLKHSSYSPIIREMDDFSCRALSP